MKDPAFPFYAQDFLVGTMHMTFAETGAYIKLLAYQWTNKGISKKRLGFILGSGWETVWLSISDKFIEKDGIIYNQRLEAEREKRAAFKQKQSENGQKGGRPKKSEPSDYKLGKTSKPQLKNPAKSQKKPLEDENENEYESEYVIENGKEGMGEKPKIVYPFESDEFIRQWEVWKNYRANEDGFKYRSVASEQAALTKLGNLSQYNQAQAIAIMHQSMANGWKGFFEVKQHEAKQPSGKSKTIYSSSFKGKIAERLQSG